MAGFNLTAAELDFLRALTAGPIARADVAETEHSFEHLAALGLIAADAFYISITLKGQAELLRQRHGNKRLSRWVHVR